MKTDIKFTLLLVASLGMLPAIGAAPAGDSSLTLDQAVLNAQRQTGGQVLSAEPHRMGRRLEYRIKVLTPEGHVKVMAISSDDSRNPNPVPAQPVPPHQNPPFRMSGIKERH